jgi:hypothetical protein
MRRSNWLVALAALVLAVATRPATAAAFLVELGDAHVALEVPAGFADTGFLGSPRIEELAQSLTPASNRILLFALTDADLRAFENGDRPLLRRYMIVVIARNLVRRSVSLDDFAKIAHDTLIGLSKPTGRVDLRKYLDGRPVGQPSLLTKLRDDPEVVSVLEGSRVGSEEHSDEGTSPYLLSTTTWLLLRGRALSVSVYTGFNGPADLEWIEFVTHHWIEQLQRINRR